MWNSVDQAVKPNTHNWRSTPRIYWKNSAFFCATHFSEVWCKKCIVPVHWCIKEPKITCDICRPNWWKQYLQQNKEDSDNDLSDAESTDTDNSERIQDIPENIPDMGPCAGEEPAPGEQEMGEQPENNDGIPVGVEAELADLEDQHAEQLLYSPSQHIVEGNQEQLHNPNDKPQEEQHYHAKRGEHTAETPQAGPLHGATGRSQSSSPTFRIPFRPRKLLFGDDDNQHGGEDEGNPLRRTTSYIKRGRDVSESDGGIRNNTETPNTNHNTDKENVPTSAGTNKRRKLGEHGSGTKETESLREITNTTEGTAQGQNNVERRGLEEIEHDQQVPCYTFIIRERPKPKEGGRAPSFTTADHGDHWHITFFAVRNNVSRKRRSICTYLGLGDNASLEATASTILIKAVKNWILYLIRYGLDRLHYFGTINSTFRTIINYFRDNPIGTDAVDGPCPYMTAKREQRKDNNFKHTMKNTEYDYIHETLEKTKAYTVKELLSKLTEEEYKTMYCTLGNSYKDKFRNVLQFKNQQRKTENNNKPVMEQLNNKIKHKGNQENIKWIEELMKENEIDIIEFMGWFILIADKKLTKINTFIMKGPTGTAKTLTLTALLSRINTGTVTRNSENNTFHLQNLLARNYALFEEPMISKHSVDEYKLLLEGSNFEINVKNSDMETLHRIPIFISTNRDIDYWVPPADGQALQSRSKTFELKKEIRGLSDRANTNDTIGEPPGRITLEDFVAIYKKNEDQIEEYVSNRVSTSSNTYEIKHTNVYEI